MIGNELNATVVLKRLITQAGNDGSVLDVGCLNFRQYHVARNLGLTGQKHSGVDFARPEGQIPSDFDFQFADLNKSPIPFSDNSFDLVIASHVIEHLAKPVEFFGDCARVCKPGGIIYVEAPSERSLMLPGMPFHHDKFLSTSFFDDPTHSFRPWTPQAFHRLTKYYQCVPLQADYYYSRVIRLLFPLLMIYALVMRDSTKFQNWTWRACGWSCFLIARKPNSLKGKPEFKYFVP